MEGANARRSRNDFEFFFQFGGWGFTQNAAEMQWQNERHDRGFVSSYNLSLRKALRRGKSSTLQRQFFT